MGVIAWQLRLDGITKGQPNLVFCRFSLFCVIVSLFLMHDCLCYIIDLVICQLRLLYICDLIFF